jgi:uncharacterized NAD(P)/FAD-binding protein YdhS
MDTRAEPDGDALTVAIIGGGASGTLTAVQLLHGAADSGVGLRIVLIDEHGRHGLGVAYSTDHDAHLLNAVAGQMSAFPDDPGHLIRWANAADNNSRLAPHVVSATTFLPRAAYGWYLRDVLADAEWRARPAGQLTRLTEKVVAVRHSETGSRLRVMLGDGHLDADAAVLAVGNAPVALPFYTRPTSRIISDPWRPSALAGLLGCTGPRTVVIVGTGLTMVDLAIAITAADPDVVVHAVSRHGLLPRTHPGVRPQPERPAWLPVVSRTTEQVRLTKLVRQVRTAVAANPADWHDVLCALRPHVPGLWRQLPVADKRAFLRHVARYWEIHRHLVPPPTASRVAALRLAGRLVIHRGQVRAVRPQGERMRVLLDSGADAVELQADWLVNGTGATTDVTANASPLLRDLFRSGLARPDPLRLGIDASADGAVIDSAGTPSDVLYTLGPPLRGLWYETTAIPEIRAQAAALARLITSDDRLARRQPNSAA